MVFGCDDHCHEIRTNILEAIDDAAILLDLDVKPFHETGSVSLTLDESRIVGGYHRVLSKIVLPAGRLVGGRANERLQVGGAGDGAFVEDGNRVDQQSTEQRAPPVGRKESPGCNVEHIEFEKIVRQGVVEDGVLGVDPFAIDEIPRAKSLPESIAEPMRPTLQVGKVQLAWAAGEIVAAALQ